MKDSKENTSKNGKLPVTLRGLPNPVIKDPGDEKRDVAYAEFKSKDNETIDKSSIESAKTLSGSPPIISVNSDSSTLDTQLPIDKNSQSDELSVANTMPSGISPENLNKIAETDDFQSTFFENLTREHAGRYNILGDIGKGGIGKVIRVLDTHIGREIAVKELLGSQGGGSKWENDSQMKTIPNQAELRFLNEARITGYLEHPGIVPVYEVGHKSDGAIYYTMKLVRGKTMSGSLKDKNLNDRLELLPSFIDICNAMAYAHKHGVIHRDLKPENVMIGEFGQTIVLDWGLAKMNDIEDLNKGNLAVEISRIKKSIGAETEMGQPMGTPSYMPPEQARGDVDDMDERTDVYMLGAILYEILTGRPPHKGENPMATLLSILTDEIDDPLTIDSHIPPELAAIAMKALQKEKKSRYENAVELSMEVRSFINGGVVGIYHYSSWELLKRWIVKNRTRISIISVLIVVALGSWWYRGYRIREESKQQEKIRIVSVLDQVEQILKKTASGKEKGERWFDIYSYKLISLKEMVVERLLGVELSKNSSPEVRKLAAKALGGMKSTISLKPLMERLEVGGEKHEGVIVEIINALGIIGDERSNKVVKEARWRCGQYGFVWNRTELAYKMIPTPDLKVEKEGLSASDLYNHGNSLKHKGHYGKAMVFFLKSIKKDPLFAKAYNNVGILLRYKKQHSKSIKYLSKAIELDPDYLAPYSNRANVWSDLDDYDKAIKDINIAIEMSPKRAGLRLNRSAILIKMGRLNSAILDLKRAIELNPASAKYQLNLARILVIKGEYEKALGKYRGLIKRNPSFIFPHVDITQIYFLKKDYVTAENSLARAYEIDPKDLNVISWFIRIHRKTGNLVKSEKEFLILDKLHHKNGFSQIFKAIIFHFQDKEYSKATDIINKILSSKLEHHFKVQYSLHLLSVMVRNSNFKGWRQVLESLTINKKPSWTEEIVLYLLGKISLEQIGKKALSFKKRFDFNYYTGLKYELEGNSKRAILEYKKVVNTSFIEDYEYIFAIGALVGNSSKPQVVKP
jgi:serine/threonine protein kinase/tetratricopeptide (TPR) repeat protein